MRQTLFWIPNEIAGVPLLQSHGYGIGLLLLGYLIVAGWLLFRRYRSGPRDDMAGAVLFYAVVAAGIFFGMPHLAEPQGLAIRGYGVMFLLAVVSGLGLAVYRGRQMGVHSDIILGLAFAAFVAGLIGARGLYVAEYWSEFQRPTWGEQIAALLNFTKGGLVVYGSLIGGTVAFLWFVRKYRLPPLALADIVVASLLVGQGIGRLGCLMNGCCYGGLCELPVAVTFPWGSPPVNEQVLAGKLPLHGLQMERPLGGPAVIADVLPNSPAAEAGLKAGDRVIAITRGGKPLAVESSRDLLAVLLSARPAELPVQWTFFLGDGPPRTLHAAELPRSLRMHPVQLYAAIGALLLALLAWAYFPFRRRDGEVFALMLSIFPLMRILEETIRVDEPQNFLLGMTISQTISLGLLLSAAALWMLVLRQPRGNLVQPDDWAAANLRYQTT